MLSNSVNILNIPFPVIPSMANTTTKPTIAKRPLSCSENGVNPLGMFRSSCNTAVTLLRLGDTHFPIEADRMRSACFSTAIPRKENGDTTKLGTKAIATVCSAIWLYLLPQKQLHDYKSTRSRESASTAINTCHEHNFKKAKRKCHKYYEISSFASNQYLFAFQYRSVRE